MKFLRPGDAVDSALAYCVASGALVECERVDGFTQGWTYPV